MDTPSEHAAALSIRFAAGAYHTYPRIEVITANGQAPLTGRDHIWFLIGSQSTFSYKYAAPRI